MRNVSGIAQTEAQKSSDLFLKCRYLDELTHNRGVVFATGTPVSNSMVELYTMQRYLQYDTLIENNLQNFDAWASTFGEVLKTLDIARLITVSPKVIRQQIKKWLKIAVLIIYIHQFKMRLERLVTLWN